ncbi:MAG TPA: hypothetical protein VJB36_09675 [Methylomirabilota bacterium]|nr:hypothetical protein [Methylomirabilota bacterium]
MFGRRLLVLLVGLAALGIPAGVLRAVCVGETCDPATAPARIPFCPLPAGLKADLVAGFRAGRSPDVLAVTRTFGVSSGVGHGAVMVPWPSVSGGPSTGVPIALWGAGVNGGVPVPNGTGLDQIAPTLSDVLGFRRPHPEVRSGAAIEGVANGERPRLVIEIAWKNVGSADLRADREAWPFLRSLIHQGAGTLSGDTGSVPLDPAATLTTIGTGGPPSQHGITGTLLRNESGGVVGAWGPGSPFSVITTLPDDLDERFGERPLIGLVAPDIADRGIIGGNWYIGHDRDVVLVARVRDAVGTAERTLATGFGRDEVPDVLAIVLRGSVGSMDRWTRELVAAATRTSRGSVVVAVAGTGASGPLRTTVGPTVSEIVAHVEAGVTGGGNLVAGAVAGGLFLDQDVLAQGGISGDAAVQALLKATGPGGVPLMADAFQGFAVSFARYC